MSTSFFNGSVLYKWQGSPSNISDIPKSWTSNTYINLWLGFMKEYFEYTATASWLVWKFMKDLALPANHTYKKIDTWGQHNTIKLTW